MRRVNVQVVEQRAPPDVGVKEHVGEPDDLLLKLREDREATPVRRVRQPATPHRQPISLHVTVESRNSSA